MATLLLIVIYLAYISLGIPDSLFGTAWPVMHNDFALPVDIAGYLAPAFMLTSVISSLFSSRVINRFGTGRVAAFSTALTVVGLVGTSFSGNIFLVLLCSIPLGLGAGAIDSALNSYVAVHYKAIHMNFLHCFYGVGVSVSPIFMSRALESTGRWENGYRNAAIVQFAIAFIMFVSLPLWNKVKQIEADSGRVEVESRNASFGELIKNPAIIAVWLCFISSCSVEHLCSTWGSSYLVGARGFEPDDASMTVTAYFIGLTLGRFLSGLLSVKLSSWKIIFCGTSALACAIIILFLPLPAAAAGIGLFFCGFGVGPIYPNLMHLTPSSFGEDISASVIGSQMAAAYIGLMCMPFVIGGIVRAVGIEAFPWCALVIFYVFVAALTVLVKTLKKQGRNVS